MEKTTDELVESAISIHDNYCTKECKHYKPTKPSNCSIYKAIIEPLIRRREVTSYTETIFSTTLRNDICSIYKVKGE